MVKTLLLAIHGAWVQSLVRELRSYIPRGKKKKQKTKTKNRSWGEKGGKGKTGGKQEGRGIR